MADPNRLRVSDPVCQACGQQVKTVALHEGLYRCPACTLAAKGLPLPSRTYRDTLKTEEARWAYDRGYSDAADGRIRGASRASIDHHAAYDKGYDEGTADANA